MGSITSSTKKLNVKESTAIWIKCTVVLRKVPENCSKVLAHNVLKVLLGILVNSIKWPCVKYCFYFYS